MACLPDFLPIGMAGKAIRGMNENGKQP